MEEFVVTYKMPKFFPDVYSTAAPLHFLIVIKLGDDKKITFKSKPFADLLGIDVCKEWLSWAELEQQVLIKGIKSDLKASYKDRLCRMDFIYWVRHKLFPPCYDLSRWAKGEIERPDLSLFN
jgi:hypothetical protein